MSQAVLVLACTILVAGVSGAPYRCFQEDVEVDIVALTCGGVDLGTLDAFLSELDALAVDSNIHINLELQESALTELPPDFLKSYPIRSLTFFNDNLTEVPQEILSNVDSDLIVLDLSLNFIDTLKKNEFDAMPFTDTLQVLVLAQNGIVDLPNHNLFGAFPSLQKLLLQMNRIGSLQDDTFTDLDALTELHLYGNEIATVTANAFGNLPALQRLYLDQNQIQFVENGTLSDEKVPMLEKIYLGNNPFYCDCTLDWFKVWLEQRNLLFGSDATCAYPNLEPFSLAIFCPASDPTKDQQWANVRYEQYVRYVESIIMQDPREREYRLTHRLHQ